MTLPLSARLDRTLETLPRAYPGPGGAVAVLRKGQVLVRHAWGWANAERRIPFTPSTLFRMCSITKQFTCALMLDAFPNPAVLDNDVRRHLPLLQGPAPTALHLAHNQSGLRDYWAVAMLHGSPVEAPFGDAEAARLIAATRTLHFIPGTRFSYVNQNFRILSGILGERTGRSFAELLRTRIFDPSGMTTAFLAADTSALPDGTQGYEGTQTTGFRPAVNRILWTGDAGLGASLDDMIAWERHIDATRNDPASLYQRLSPPVTFEGGNPAPYGFGLGRRTEWGRLANGHGGALRGWRSHRIHFPTERLSVAVLFNHLSDAQAAALDLAAALLDEDRPNPEAAPPPPDWLGAYIEPETRLAVRITPAPDGHIFLRYGHNTEHLTLHADGTAAATATLLRPGPGGLWMDRPQENQSSLLHPCNGEPQSDIAGRYRCAELAAELTIAGDVAPYGAFSGFLGLGRMELLDPVGPGLWALPCPRGLDHTPPGDWTLAFNRDPAGKTRSVEVGCWLARRLRYDRVG